VCWSSDCLTAPSCGGTESSLDIAHPAHIKPPKHIPDKMAGNRRNICTSHYKGTHCYYINFHRQRQKLPYSAYPRRRRSRTRWMRYADLRMHLARVCDPALLTGTTWACSTFCYSVLSVYRIASTNWPTYVMVLSQRHWRQCRFYWMDIPRCASSSVARDLRPFPRKLQIITHGALRQNMVCPNPFGIACLYLKVAAESW